jgi:hypothetical protein
MGNKIVTRFSMFNESEAYIFEDSKNPLMIPTEATLIEIMERQKKYNRGKDSKPTSSVYKTWKQRQDSLDIYNKMSPEEKGNVLDAAKKEFARLKITDIKYKAVIEQSSDKESKNAMYVKPYVIVTKEEIVTVVPGDKDDSPVEDVKFPSIISLIPDDAKNNLFKDNRWENTPEAYTDPSGLALVKENLDLIKKMVKADISSKGKSIKNISIVSSCSRLRNTGDEALSWYELSKKRSETFTQILLDRLKELDLDEAYKKSLQDRIKITFSGFNGDGTSGPDPLAPYKRGYYDKSGKFINEVDRKLKGKSTLDILVALPGQEPKLQKALDLNGLPITSELKDNKVDYKQYQYNDIIVTFNPDETNKEPEEIDPARSMDAPKTKIINKYNYIVALRSTPWSPPKDGPDFDFDLGKLAYKMKKMMPKGKSPDWSKCIKNACPNW